jgi:hypothetical protein
MQREIIFDKLEQFTGEIKRLKIKKLAFAEINEKRAVEVEPGKVQVVDVSILEILAYKDATVYKCKIRDADFDSIHEILLDEGFDIVRRSRNIT